MMKKTLSTISAIGILAGAGVLINDAFVSVRINNLPNNEKLKVKKEEILESRINGNEIKYFYKGDSVPVENNEIVSERTENHRVFKINDNQYKMRVYAKGTFIKDENTQEWRTMESATTTKEAYNLQVSGIITLLKAAVSNVYETQDTFYGTVFDAGPNDTHLALKYGGWGDHYYSYIQWDLTGTPPSSQTTDCRLFLNASKIATNWADVQIRRVTSSWDETTVTRTVNPTDAGATGQIDQTQPIAIDTYYSTSILTFYNNWKDGVWTNYGLKLHDVGSNSDAQGDYYSSNNTGTDKDPYLEITYNPSSSTIFNNLINFD